MSHRQSLPAHAFDVFTPRSLSKDDGCQLQKDWLPDT